MQKERADKRAALIGAAGGTAPAHRRRVGGDKAGESTTESPLPHDAPGEPQDPGSSTGFVLDLLEGGVSLDPWEENGVRCLGPVPDVRVFGADACATPAVQEMDLRVHFCRPAT